MNAPADLSARTIEYLPLADIAPSETEMQKLRRARILAAPAALGELAASIKADGVHLPLIVRPLATIGNGEGLPKYELVAGERRWRAAGLAGLGEVPAIVRALDDRQALRLQIAENLQRETLSALEEAEGYRALRDTEGLKVEDLVGVVGKSRAWIYDRLKLLDLPPEGREALLTGALDPYLALAVARVNGKKQQAKALKRALEPGMTVRTLKHVLTGAGFTVSLRGAPFPIDVVTLNPAKGACSTCPDRTGNGSEFDADEDDPDVCTDPACYQVKVRTQGEEIARLAREQGRHVLTGPAAREIAPKPGILLGHLDLDEANEDDECSLTEPTNPDSPEYAAWEKAYEEWRPRTWRALLTAALKDGETLEPVLIQDPVDERIRELMPVDLARRLLKRIKVELPSWLGEARQEPQRYQPPTAAQLEEQRKAREAQVQKEQRELAHRARVGKAIFAKWKGKLSRMDLEEIAEHAIADGGAALVDVLFNTKRSLSALNERELQALLLLTTVERPLSWAGHNPAPLWALAKRLKIDPLKLKDEQPAKAAKKASKKARRK